MLALADHEISRFPCMERAYVPGSSTTPGCPSACAGALGHIAFRYTDSVGTRDQFSIAAQWLACTFPYRRFADSLADACARLGADVVRYSFIAVDLHHLLLAGLPAHLCENSKNRKTTRIIFRKNLRPDKPAKFRRPEMTFGGMPILRRCSAAAFLHNQDPERTSARLDLRRKAPKVGSVATVRTCYISPRHPLLGGRIDFARMASEAEFEPTPSR